MHLGKVSTLGEYEVNLSNNNLNQLIGGNHLTLPCILSKNKNRVKLHALANSRANNLMFLNNYVTRDITTFYNVSLKPLPHPICVEEYNGNI